MLVASMAVNTKYSVLKEYRKNFRGSLLEQRSTYLSDLKQLAGIQLAVIFLHKKKQITSISLSNIELVKLQERINAKHSNVSSLPTPLSAAVDVSNICGFIEIYDSYRTFLKQCNLIDHFDTLASASHQTHNEIGYEVENIEDKCIERSPSTSLMTQSSCEQSPANKTVIRIQSIFLSYMELVVNPKNEIALSQVIDSPSRGIDQKSFTEIRRMAIDKNLSMYQVISSFVRQLALGGKGYAPTEHHALFKTKEGLVEFMKVMDQLQTVIDESSNIDKAIGAILKSLKLTFIRANVLTFKTSSVLTAIENLQKEYKVFSSNASRNETKELVLYLRDYMDWTSCHGCGMTCEQLCGVLSTPKTAEKSVIRKFPSLKTQFTTPENNSETPKKVKMAMKFVRKRETRNFGGFGEVTNRGETHIDQSEKPQEVMDETVASPDHADIKFIRCLDNSPLATKLLSPVKLTKINVNIPSVSKPSVSKPLIHGKENKKKAAVRKTVNNKNKVVKKKKVTTLAGQKSLTLFFKPTVN